MHFAYCRAKMLYARFRGDSHCLRDRVVTGGAGRPTISRGIGTRGSQLCLSRDRKTLSLGDMSAVYRCPSCGRFSSSRSHVRARSKVLPRTSLKPRRERAHARRRCSSRACGLFQQRGFVYPPPLVRALVLWPSRKTSPVLTTLPRSRVRRA